MLEAQTERQRRYLEVADDDGRPDLMRVAGAGAGAFVGRAERLVTGGRPTCPYCGEALDPAVLLRPRQRTAELAAADGRWLRPPHAGFDPEMRIDWIEPDALVPSASGRLGLTFLPGKRGPRIAIRGTPIGVTRRTTWPRCDPGRGAAHPPGRGPRTGVMGRPSHRGARIAGRPRGGAPPNHGWLAAGIGGGDGSDPGPDRSGTGQRRRGGGLHGRGGTDGDGGGLCPGARRQHGPAGDRRDSRAPASHGGGDGGAGGVRGPLCPEPLQVGGLVRFRRRQLVSVRSAPWRPAARIRASAAVAAR